MSWSVVTWVVNTWITIWNYFENSLSMSPSTFRSWLWWVLKTIWMWFLHNWYWFVWFVVVYVVVIVVYNYLWWKVVVYFQKKWYKEYLKSINK